MPAHPTPTMCWSWGIGLLLLPAAALSCLPGTGPGGIGCDPGPPPPDVETVALLGRPFGGEFAVVNYFDHDLPGSAERGNGFQLTFCGSKYGGFVDGHVGYDWPMPIGTPLRAVFDGRVTFAGREPEFLCRGVLVSGIQVQIRHDLPGDTSLVAVYAHLDRFEVSAGDSVPSGVVIGGSGSTGCSTEPHLHFQVWQSVGGAAFRTTDPYGWWPTTDDPWRVHPFGTKSRWLWRAGEAPSLEAARR